MRDPLSKKITGIAPSGIRKFFDIVSEMPDAISLGVGEPDFDTPWRVREEGIYTLEKGRTFYTSNAGLKELRQEISNYLDRKIHVRYDYVHEVMVTVGGSEGIDLTMRAMLNPGDEVLVPEPSYVSYAPCVTLADEIYSELTYKTEHVSIASLPGMRERTLVVNGFSKGLAMTGWRLGYICGPQIIMEQMVKIHQYAILCAPTNSQYAAIEGLKNCDDEIQKMRTAYNERRRYLMHTFKEMGLRCFEPFGAFYVFPNIQEFGMTSEEFATELLREEKVAVVPGSAFGASGEGYIRISYAYSLDDLKEALGRVNHFIEKLRKK